MSIMQRMKNCMRASISLHRLYTKKINNPTGYLFRFEDLPRTLRTMSLSIEVLFVILEEIKVEDVSKFSSLCTEFRQTCKDKALWRRIFNKHNLVMLKESCSLHSWVLNFQNSLVSKRLVDKVIRGNKEDGSIIEEVRLQSVVDASLIHVPGVTDEDELEGFLFLAQFNTKNSLAQVDESIMQGIDNPYKASLVVAFYLQVDREGDTYYLSIEQRDIIGQSKKKYIKRKLDREQLSFLLYKLACHSLLKIPFQGRSSMSCSQYRLNYNI